ncbi:hypothetical protein SUGI_0402860 [Cryptomeria japonica]|nr:hypothetical protein SUGI_0402860 [Cryptomeria japonica]
MADFLANVALKNDDATLTGISTVEIKSRPAIPDNVYNWQVFADDEDILREIVFGNDLVQLETNEIPKGLVELEIMFSYNDNHLHQQSTTKLEELEEVNLGIESSPKADDHCGHLEKVFNKALEFGVSLNPKKCHFGVTEGKLLGHIVSKEEVRIDPERIEVINKVSQPKNVKVVAVLLQKDNERYEHPIAFYSKYLQATELKYETMEKQAYALVKAVKAFRPYLVNANIIAYVPHAAVKDILSQSEVTGKRCRWINRIQEFDLEIKITKLVRGLGLAKLMIESNLMNVEIHNVEVRDASITSIERQLWYSGIVRFLRDATFSEGMTHNQKRTLKLKSQKYVLIQGDLFWRKRDGELLMCFDEFQAKQVLIEMHDGACGGHYSAKTTAGEIILAGYFWPTLFKDAHAYVRKCDPCQKFSSKLKYEGALPLNPVSVEAPFVQWGIDFIREIVERSGRGHRWIIVATDYFTKWIEAIPTRRATSKVVIDFLMDNVITRFGTPAKLVRMPVNNLLSVYKFLQNEDMGLSEPMESIMIQIVEVEELRTLAHKRNQKIQLQSKYLFDKRTSLRKFQIDDIVLQWNAKG